MVLLRLKYLSNSIQLIKVFIQLLSKIIQTIDNLILAQDKFSLDSIEFFFCSKYKNLNYRVYLLDKAKLVSVYPTLGDYIYLYLYI